MINSFLLAFSGILRTIKKERNIKIHLLAAFLVVFLGVTVGLTKPEWLVIVFLIGVILAAEIFNSCIEEICNLLNQKLQLAYKETKVIRDVSAGAVLILAITSVVLALIIFFPYL